MEVHFVVAHADGRSKKFRLTNEEYVVIGRSKTLCQVDIEDKLCSSTHSKISVHNNAIYVEDLNSKNGVFLNGVKILKQRIYVDDKVRFGDSLLFINHSRMNDESIGAVTFHGKYSRQGNMTLELDPKLQSETAKSLNKLIKRRSLKKSSSSNRRRSMTSTIISQMKIRNAFYIDLLLAIVVLGLTNAIFYLIFYSDYSGVTGRSILIDIFKGNAFKYTIASMIITTAFHLINIKQPSGSIGQKLLKVN